MMKVLLVNKFFHLAGGSERVLFQEREFLLSRGVEVVDFSMKDPKNLPSSFSKYFVENVDYYGENGIGKKIKGGISFVHSREAVKDIEGLVTAEKPNIAHLHNIYHQLTPAIIPALKERGVKVVLTLHDYKLICPTYSMLRRGEICEDCVSGKYSKCFTTNCTGSIPRSLLLSIEACWHKLRKSYSYVDRFIAPSRFMADKVGIRVPEEKIVVLYNGMDTSRKNLSDEDEGYALFFGRLSREKGVETLLKAHEELGGEYILKVAGGGPQFEELRENYREATFLGYLDSAELEAVTRRSSFVAVPSEWYENCSMAVLEAMCYGKPVIGSNIGGIPEQIVDGKTGLLFNMGDSKDLSDKMRMLFDDVNLRKRMGVMGRERVEEKYSLRDHCEKLLEIYKDL